MSEAVKGLGKEERQKQGFTTGVVRLFCMCAMALPKGQTHVGQMKPVTPEEEEREKNRKSMRRRLEECNSSMYNPVPHSYLKHALSNRCRTAQSSSPKQAIRDVFYNRCDPADVDEALTHLGSSPPGPLTVPVTYTAYREIPSTYIVCEDDNALPLSVQERMIAQGKGVFHVERCEEGHSLFFFFFLIQSL